jgi:hypothetical protein
LSGTTDVTESFNAMLACDHGDERRALGLDAATSNATYAVKLSRAVKMRRELPFAINHRLRT